jgi:hypothetical protein
MWHNERARSFDGAWQDLLGLHACCLEAKVNEVLHFVSRRLASGEMIALPRSHLTNRFVHMTVTSHSILTALLAFCTDYLERLLSLGLSV